MPPGFENLAAAQEAPPVVGTVAPSRSPSPVSMIGRRPGMRVGQAAGPGRKVDYEAVKAELAKNGFEHIALDGQVGSLHEQEVRVILGQYHVDQVRGFLFLFNLIMLTAALYAATKILRDRHSMYVTFRVPDGARRAAMLITAMGRKLANQPVTVTVRSPPTHVPTAYKTSWTNAELVEEAEKKILQELRAFLEKDVTERMVVPLVRKVVHEERAKKGVRAGPELAPAAPDHPHDPLDTHYIDRADLRNLSFRKSKKRQREEPVAETTPAPVEVHEEVVVERPKKKPKKAAKKVVVEKDIESEDEEDAPVPIPVLPARKRAVSEASDIEVPLKKKAKDQPVLEDEVVPIRTKKSKKAVSRQPAFDDDVVHEVLPETLPFEQPAVAQLRVTPFEDTPSPLFGSPDAAHIALPRGPPVDPIAAGICEDEEDMYYARLALERKYFGESSQSSEPEADADAPAPFRKHQTGSARTEGYYKISHAEKSAYVAQYQLRHMSTTVAADTEHSSAPPKQVVGSSRANRANARRRAQGLEEMNQVQRAMALSKGQAAAPDSMKYNQLQARKKQLRFARSPIHDWGLYAMEKINRGDLVIEYVGEVIRAQVADKREKAYERQGIGSSYLFRIDEDLVVDATKKGNLGYVSCNL